MICLQTFKAKIGSLRKALKSQADFHFINAPHLVASASEEEVRESGGSAAAGRAWWQFTVSIPASMCPAAGSCEQRCCCCRTQRQA